MTEHVPVYAHPEAGSHRPGILQDDRLEDRGLVVRLLGAPRPPDQVRLPFARILTLDRSSMAATR